MTSSSPTPTPYLGSKISLISKSEIRYEGILYTVDTKESTIALAKVKSFGTEDRPTEHPVAAREEVYEYIIFKASDIKDLMVCEVPKQVSCLVGGLPSDPAIVQISSTQISQNHHQPAPTSFPPAPIKAAPVQSKAISSSRGSDAGVQTGQRKEPLPPRNQPENRRLSNYQQQRNYQQQFQRDFPPFPRGFRPPPFPPMPGNFRVPYGQGGRDGERGPPRFPMPPGFHRGFYPDRRLFGPQPWGGPMPFGPGRRGFQGGRGGGPQQRGDRQQRISAPLKFDGDYDFEEANQKFKETLEKLSAVKISEGKSEGKDGEKTIGVIEEVAEEAEEGEVTSSDDLKSYDKAKSFFDSISCEAAERAEQKPTDRANWGRQRDRNQETFGQTAVHRYGYGGGFRRYDNAAPFRERFRS